MLKFICYKPVKIHDTLKPKFAFLNLPWGHFVNRKAKHALWSCLIQVLIALTTLSAADCKVSCDPFTFKFTVQISSWTGIKNHWNFLQWNWLLILLCVFWTASFHLVPTNFCKFNAPQQTGHAIYGLQLKGKIANSFNCSVFLRNLVPAFISWSSNKG